MSRHYDGPERRQNWVPPESPEPHEPQRFHIEKSVSIGHIFTTISMALAAVVYATNVEKRVTLLEANDKYILEVVNTNAKQTTEERRELMTQLAEIRADIKRLITEKR